MTVACPGLGATSGRALPAPCSAVGQPHAQDTRPPSKGTGHDRETRGRSILKPSDKATLGRHPQNPPQIPVIWPDVVAAGSVGGRPYVPTENGLEIRLREQLGTFAAGRLLTQNEEGKK